MAIKPVKLKKNSFAVKQAIKDPTKISFEQIQVGDQVFKKSDGFKGLAGLSKKAKKMQDKTVTKSGTTKGGTTKFDPTLQTPSGTLQAGVFIDPNTGATIDTRDMSGNSPYSTFQEYQADKDSGFALASSLSGDGASYEAPEDSPFESIEEEAKYRVSGEVGETADLMAELGIDTHQAPPGTLEEMIDQFYTQQQKSDLESLEKEQEFANLVDERALKAAGETAESQMAAVEASLMPGREGFVGGTAVPAVREFQQRVAVEMDTAKKRVDLAKQQRATAMANLKRAQDRGDFELAERLKGSIAQAESAIRTETSNLIELEQRNAQIALDTFQTLGADQRASYATFQNLMESGVQMDTTSLINMANSLGLPADVVNSAYQGMQSIRDDKKLSLQEKQIGIQQEMNKLRDYQLGLSSATAKKVDDFLKLSQSGNYTPEQLQSFAVAMDIPNDQNPVWVNEQEMKALELDIAKKQSQGIPTSISDYMDLMDLQQKQNELYGIGGEALVPTDPIDGLNVSYEGGGLVITREGGFRKYQCGEFVNRVWGLSSGGSGGFGSTPKSKTDIVDARGIKASDINMMNYKDMLKPGMAFVMDGGNNGHVGIITYIGDNGKIGVMEANVGEGSNLKEGTVPTTGIKDINDGAIYGYAYPPSYDVVEGKAPELTGEQAEYTPSDITMFNKWDGKKVPDAFTGSKQEFLSMMNKFEEAKYDADLPLSTRVKYTKGLKDITDKVGGKYDALISVENQLSNLEAALMETNPTEFGRIENMVTSVNPFSTKRREIEAMVTALLPRAARGIFGEVGVLTDSDIERYAQTLPKLTDSGAQREAVIGIMRDMIANTLDKSLKIDGGTYDLTGFASLAAELEAMGPQDTVEEGTTSVVDDDVSLYEQIYTKTSTLGDTYLDEISTFAPDW